MTRRLVRNAVRCCICGDVIESRHRTDYKRCVCGNAMVDGGLDYRRTGQHEPDSIQPLYEYADV